MPAGKRRTTPASRPTTKEGVVELVTNDGCVQKVKCDDGSVEWLMGIASLSGAQAGERVILEYRSSTAYALWFARRV